MVSIWYPCHRGGKNTMKPVKISYEWNKPTNLVLVFWTRKCAVLTWCFLQLLAGQFQFTCCKKTCLLAPNNAVVEEYGSCLSLWKATQIQLNPRAFHHQCNWRSGGITSISRQDPPKAGSKGQPGNLFEADLERLMGRMCWGASIGRNGRNLGCVF